MLECKSYSDVPISDADREESVRLGIIRARERSAYRGFTPGEVVIHESISITMTLKAVEDGAAILWVDHDESTIRRVPYDELIDRDILELETRAALSDVVLGLVNQSRQ